MFVLYDGRPRRPVTSKRNRPPTIRSLSASANGVAKPRHPNHHMAADIQAIVRQSRPICKVEKAIPRVEPERPCYLVAARLPELRMITVDPQKETL
jgi:hypothetical protein